MTAPSSSSVRLVAAADDVEGWAEPYAEPLAELLRAEAQHAADLADDGWDRYPPGALLLRLADGILQARTDTTRAS